MSQITFSHQFPHRWLAAPKQVKTAIVQELDDIVTLLDNDTDLESFKFSTPDLRHYVNQIYADLAQRQTDDIEAADTETNNTETDNIKTSFEQKPDNVSKTLIEDNNTIYVDSDAPSLLETHPNAVVKESTETVVSTLPNKVNGDSVHLDEDFLHELEVRIDDYLTEQLSDISENLKAWLREEVKQYMDKK